MRRGVATAWLGLALACGGAAACGGASASRDADAPEPGGLVVRRGDFRERFLLTGELGAVRADEITVPRTPSWQIQIRWMETDGAMVEAGQKVLEFDNTSFAGALEEKRVAVAQAEHALLRQQAQIATTEAEDAFQIEQRRVALEKARIDAEVPRELRPAREYEEKQLALDRARTEYEKARETQQAHRRAAEADLAVRRIELEKARREIRTAESAIGALTLFAPRSGVLVVGEHPWEGRKFQVGDSAWVGLVVMSLPDLSEMEVIAALSDVDDGRVAPGMPAACTLDAYPEDRFDGVVREITPIAQEAGRRSLRRAFTVGIALAKSDPARMRPGMSVKVEIDAGRLEGATLAARAGLDLSSDPPRARLRDGGEVVVRLGPCNALECVVEEGLAEGTVLRAGRPG